VGDFSGDTGALLALEKRLRQVSKTGARQVGDAVASEVQRQIDEGFRGGHAPDGAKWAPKSSLSKPGPTLVGESMSATASATHKGGTVTATIGGKWAHVHQSGITIYPKRAAFLSWVGGSGRVFAKKVTIPARPMLPPDADLPAAWDSAMQRAAGFKLEGMLT
jgi:phage gpG-like protein